MKYFENFKPTFEIEDSSNPKIIINECDKIYVFCVSKNQTRA